MSDFRGSKRFDKALKQLLDLPEREIPKDLRGLITQLRCERSTDEPDKKVGRPKDTNSKFSRVFLYAWFTLNVPDSGEFRTKSYRTKLNDWILDALNISEDQLNRSKAIWNSYAENDLEEFLSLMPVYLDENDPIGSRITTIDDLRKMGKDGALTLFPVWVKAALSKYG